MTQGVNWIKSGEPEMTQGVNLMRPAEPEVTQGVNQMKTRGPGMTQGMPRDSPDKETSERRCSSCPQLTSQIRPRGQELSIKDFSALPKTP